jgi:uncharacterized protein YjiS (DUF1127 family)
MTRAEKLSALSILNASPRLSLVAALAVEFAGYVTRWHMTYRTRVELSLLDDHLLEDIGVTQAQARKEASRPFWQL